MSDQPPFPGIYRRPEPPKRRLGWPWRILIAVLAIAVAVLAGDLIRGKNGATVTSGTATSVQTTTTQASPSTSTVTAALTPAGYASRACATFDSADLFYAFPHNRGEVTTAMKISHLASLADHGEDPIYGALAADAELLEEDVASLSGGRLGDGPDAAFFDECNFLFEHGDLAGSAPPASTTTTAPAAPITTQTTAIPTPLNNTVQYSYGSTTGQVVSADVSGPTEDSAGDFDFTVNLTNRGTLAFSCDAMVAWMITSNGPTAPVGALGGSSGIICPGPSNTLPTDGSNSFAFDVPLNGASPEFVALAPFGTTESAVLEWSLDG